MTDMHQAEYIQTIVVQTIVVGGGQAGLAVGYHLSRQQLPFLEDGQTANVRDVIWCTGFDPSFDWIDLPVFGEHGPLHQRGVVHAQPGLYFVGLHFQYALSSSMVQSMSCDAVHVVDAFAAATARTGATQTLVATRAVA